MIDGVPRARTSIGFGDLGEISNIEVLRGPQNTLFGRNTSAGLIYIETEAPTKTFTSNGHLNLGNLGLSNLGASISGPINDSKLLGRIYLTALTRDGFVKANQGLVNSRKDNNQDYYLMRGQLSYNTNFGTNLRLIADYAQRAEDCCNAAVVLSDSRAPVQSTLVINRILNGGKLSGNQLSNFGAVTDRPFSQKIIDKGISLEANQSFNNMKLKSVSAFRYWNWAYGQDGEWSGADILYRDIAQGPGAKIKDFTQDLRLEGGDEKYSWVLGAFYNKQTINSHNVFRYGKDYETYIGGLLSGAAAATSPVSDFAPNLRNLVSNATSGQFNSAQAAMIEGGGWSDLFAQNAESLAFYTHNKLNLNNGISLDLGLRYTFEDKKFTGKYETTGSPACRAIENFYGFNPSANAPSGFTSVVGTVCVPWARSALDNVKHKQKFNDDNLSGNFTISKKFTESALAYLTYSRGYKAGGFNLDRVMVDNNGTIVSGAVGAQTIRAPDVSFAAETVDAYELGLKNEFMNGDLSTNVAIFNQEFNNFQLNTYNGISQIVASVPVVNSKGFEIEYAYKAPIKGLGLNGGIAYADAEYGRKLGAPNDSTSFLGRNLNLYLIAGQQLTASPKWTYTQTINYEHNIGQYIANYNLNLRHFSSFNGGSNLDPRKSIPSNNLINGRISLSKPNSVWSVELWGNNLTDEHYPQIVFDGPLQGNSPLMAASGTTRAITSQLDGFPAEPRTYGVLLRWKY